MSSQAGSLESVSGVDSDPALIKVRAQLESLCDHRLLISSTE